MSRNVDRLLKRACVSSQEPLKWIIPGLRTYAIDVAPRERSEDEKVDILRSQDQTSLRKTKEQTDRLMNSVKQLESAVSTIPTVIQHPDIPVPYTIGYLRTKVKDEIPKHAAKTIASIEHVKAHLTDLQIEPYVDRRGGQDVVEGYEREFAAMTEEQLQEELQNMLYEEEARLNRLKTERTRLTDFLAELRRNAKGSKAKVPAATGSEGNAASQSTKPNVEKNASSSSADQKPKVVTSLQDLQARLQATVGSSTKGKS